MDLKSKNRTIAQKTVQRCIEECTPPFEYERKAGECCGECVQKKCELENKLYSVGELWQSDDHCMFYQCQQDSNGLLVISEYSKSNCPKMPANCPPAEVHQKDCCQYCNATTEQLAVAATELDQSRAETNKTDYLSEETYRNHPCVRSCREGEEPMMCHYKFAVSRENSSNLLLSHQVILRFFDCRLSGTKRAVKPATAVLM